MAKILSEEVQGHAFQERFKTHPDMLAQGDHTK